MRRIAMLCLLLASCSLASCQLFPGTWVSSPQAAPTPQKTAPVAAEPVLYARDGSVMTPGAGAAGAAVPRRDVQGSEGSRAKILELYQRVVEERDRLQIALAERDVEAETLHKQLSVESSRAKDFETRLKTAEQSSNDLSTQNLELAGRLTTAQIRRLEAEKKWLELSISLPSKTVEAIENAQLVSGRKQTETASMRSKAAAKPAVKELDKTDSHATGHQE